MRAKRIIIFSLVAAGLCVLLLRVHAVIKSPPREALAVNSIVSGILAFGLVAGWRLSETLSNLSLPWRQFLCWRRWFVTAILMVCSAPLIWISGSWFTLQYSQSAVDHRSTWAGLSAVVFVASWWVAGRLLRHQMSFSLRALLLAVSLLALFLATIGRPFFVAQREQRRQALIQEIEDNGSTVSSTQRATASSHFKTEDVFDAVSVKTNYAFEELLAHPDRYGFIDCISLSRFVTLNRQKAARLNQFPSLRGLDLLGGEVWDETIDALQAWKPEKPHVLSLSDCDKLTDQAYRDLAQRRHLGSLLIMNQSGGQMELTVDRLRELSRCDRLLNLTIIGVPGMNDEGAKVLATMKQLKRLRLVKTQITPEGLELLFDALPDCRIDTDIDTDLVGSGARNVRRVQVLRPPTSTRGESRQTITDPTKIRHLFNWSEDVQPIAYESSWGRPPGKFTELIFYGKSRPLYHILVGEAECHVSAPTFLMSDRWLSYPLEKEQREKLSRLLQR